jgi:L-alanine-DL-glutamate epimerase-like enolase superfamily enzyme
VPDAAGLGIELNRDVLRKYRVSEYLMGHEAICC